MKKAVLVISGIFMLGVLVFSSCSQCYECTTESEVLVDSDGDGVADDTTTTTSSEDVCTASSEEIKEKEDNGYTCTSS